MRGLIMDYPLTLSTILRRAETLFPHKRVISRRPDKSLHQTTYGEVARRARQLAAALGQLGIRPGHRVATLAWSHHRHLEAYFGIPMAGAVLHTLNLRLHPDDLGYIAGHAGDRAILVDAALLPLLERFRAAVPGATFIVMGEGQPVPPGFLDYETLLADAAADSLVEPSIDERDAAAMCYTSGTTGRPKGVLYSHRAIVLHSFASGLDCAMGIRESDVVLPVVPMFHVNAWGLPFTATMLGAAQVFPGPCLDPASLLDLMSNQGVTITAGVPSIWAGILQALDKEPGAWNLSKMRCMLVGGAAVPPAILTGFQERHGLRVLHAWGMTETTPLGTVAALPSDLANADPGAQYRHRCMQGQPAPFVEIRARGAEQLVPWDGQTMGELEVRGPWVASAYFGDDTSDRFTTDGWFRTGDLVTIDPRGTVEIRDRIKDVIKSGGEWISSLALENALMAHPAILEAAVIAVPHPRWQERPLAVVVLRPGTTATPQELRDFLAPHFASWALPDAFEIVPEIPKTSTGKMQKSVLRERFRDYRPDARL
ncbi:MAG TPA: long-chain fatty acid--CoA ligase [Vicinamibacterales bacterium]|nr:long-chain fatty acid--CoA ligase [Vicinamibacterales bacterium]